MFSGASASGCGAAFLAVAVAASGASSAPAESPTDAAVKLDRLVVTSGRSQEPAPDPVGPVEFVPIKDLLRAGVAGSLQESLRRMFPQFMGAGNSGAENAGTGAFRTGGGSSLAWRNLPTLVLFNGRRAAVSPIAAHHLGTAFVNLNLLPLASIESVALWRDGGSARRGADAVGGVVDISLASTLRGWTVSGFYETAPREGGWENRGGNVSFGYQGDRTRFVVTGGWSRQDPLWQYQRRFSNPAYGSSSFNGQISFASQHYFVLNPQLMAPPVGANRPVVSFPLAVVPSAPDGRPYFGAVGSDAVYWGKTNSKGEVVGFNGTELAQGSSPEAAQVAFNLARWVTLLQGRESFGTTLTAEHTLGGGSIAFGDLLALRLESRQQIAPQGFGDTYLASNPLNPFGVPTAASTRVYESPRPGSWETTFGRLVVGLRSPRSSSTQFETALNLNRSRLDYVSPGQISLTAMRAAVAGARLNVFQRFVPAEELVAAEVLGTAIGEFTSTLAAWDGHITLDAGRLPGGPIQWTFGAEHRWEGLDGAADQNSQPGVTTGRTNWGGGVTTIPFAAHRSFSDVHVSASAPMLAPDGRGAQRAALDFNLDLRGQYQLDHAAVFVPAAGVRWRPWGQDLTFRAGGGRTFRPASLYQMAGPAMRTTSRIEVVSIFGEKFIDTVNLRDGSNATLRPEIGWNRSLGLVLRPARWKGVALELDYVRVSQRGVIGRLPLQEVVQEVEERGGDSRFVAGHAGSQPGFDVRFGDWAAPDGAVTAPGQVAPRLGTVYVTNPTVNLGDRDVEAVDLGVQVGAGSAERHALSGAVRVAYVVSDRFQGQETAGRATLRHGTIPRWTSVTTLAYRHHAWEFGILYRTIASVYAELDQFDTGRYQTLDLSVGYSWGARAPALLRKTEVSLRVKNLGDVEPRRAPQTFSGPKADTGTYDPLGRTWLLSIRRSFD